MKKTIQLFAAIVIAVTLPASVFAQGIMLRGVGPANEALAGTATAMPLDASGTLLWNPAGISALKKNEMSIGLELIQPHSRVTTTTAGGATLGSTKGEAGITPVPSMAFVWRKCPKSPFTYGVSLAGVGGAASLYPDTINPMDGRSATVLVLQVTPTASVQLTDRLSIGVAPVIDLASLNISPMALGGPALPPTAALHTYGTRYAWGGGFQIGTLYDFKNHFKAGFMFKSPIWAENIYFTGADGDGNPASRSFDLDLPMTLSMGISYDGFKDTVIGMDVRYFDYSHTVGFEEGVNPNTGNVDGLDWDSVWSINLGLEHKFSRKLKGRLGYCWNENPIPGRSAVLNVAAPLMQQHCVSCGVGYTFAKDLELSLAYVHAFQADITGPTPTPSVFVTNEASADTVSAGISKRW